MSMYKLFGYYTGRRNFKTDNGIKKSGYNLAHNPGPTGWAFLITRVSSVDTLERRFSQTLPLVFGLSLPAQLNYLFVPLRNPAGWVFTSEISISRESGHSFSVRDERNWRRARSLAAPARLGWSLVQFLLCFCDHPSSVLFFPNLYVQQQFRSENCFS